jgi:hypothetical protein
MWYIVRGCIWDADIAGALEADEMGIEKTFTLLAAAMICKLLTEKVVMGLPLLILWGNTLPESVNMVQKDLPGIITEEWEWYAIWRCNSVPCCLIEIQKHPPQVHPVLTSAIEAILVVTLPRVAETFMSVINKMTYAIEFKLIYLLHKEHGNVTDNNRHPRLDKPDNPWNIHFDSCVTLSYRAKRSSNGQLSHCTWSVAIIDESHRYLTTYCVGC